MMDSERDRERLARVETELSQKANTVDIVTLESRLLRKVLVIVIPIILAFFAAAVGICLALA